MSEPAMTTHQRNEMKAFVDAHANGTNKKLDLTIAYKAGFQARQKEIDALILEINNLKYQNQKPEWDKR